MIFFYLKDSHDIEVTAVCKNGSWEYNFNETLVCVRKYIHSNKIS